MNSFFSLDEVASLLGVDASDVDAWIDRGQLTTFRSLRGRRVRRIDLVRFLQQAGMQVPARLKDRRRAFLIDDDPLFMRALKRGLRRADRSLRVETFSSPVEALIRIGAECPQLVLLDVFLPGIDGVEICQRLRANPPTHDIRIIAFSGRASTSVEQRVIAAGATAFLRKPFKLQQLLELTTQ